MSALVQISCFESIPRRQHQPLRAALAKLAQLTVLEHAEGFTGVVGTHHVGRVEDVAQHVMIQAIEPGVVGIEFGAQRSSAAGVESEGRAVVAQVLRPAGQVMRGVGEFEHTRDDEGEVGFGVAVGGAGPEAA